MIGRTGKDEEVCEGETFTLDDHTATLVCNEGGRRALLVVVLIIIFREKDLILVGLLFAGGELVALIDRVLPTHVVALLLLETRGHVVVTHGRGAGANAGFGPAGLLLDAVVAFDELGDRVGRDAAVVVVVV
jgi:hypothetical protein